MAKRLMLFGVLCACAGIAILGAKGCRTIRMYPGDPLPADQVALIRLVSDRLEGGMAVEINGSSHRRIEVLPGMHEVRMSRPPMEPMPLAVINAEAGHIYKVSVLKRWVKDGSWGWTGIHVYDFKIIDVTSGSVLVDRQI